MAAKTGPSITLFTGKVEVGRYNWSPFVNKLNTRMRFAEMTYDIKAGSLSDAPKGKIPYVRISEPDSESGPIKLGDSAFITKHFVRSGLMQDLNQDLSGVEKAHDLSLRSLLEDKIFFYQSWERWMVNENFYLIRDEGPLSSIPYPLRLVVGILAYRKNSQTFAGQGTARHSPEEIFTLLEEGWSALNDVVSASQAGLQRSKRQKGQIAWVMGGDQPTEVDASLFGFLSSVLICPANPRTQAIVKSFPALLRYANEVHQQYFPDCSKWED